MQEVLAFSNAREAWLLLLQLLCMLGQLQLEESATQLLHILMTCTHPNCVLRHKMQPPCMLYAASNAHKL